MDKKQLTLWLQEEGFSHIRFLNPLLTENYGLSHPPTQARSAVLVFFPYICEEGEPKTRGKGLLAPFAQANNYKEVVTRLKRVVRLVRESTHLTKRDLPIFCNSRYPEKQMAWQCGLGTLGRNSLILSPDFGSLGVIGGFFLPFDLPGDRPLESKPYENCKTCLSCAKSCPARAIKREGGIVKDLCFQHLSTSYRVLEPAVMEDWPRILYGCQICQDVCPVNQKRPQGRVSELGKLGKGIELSFLLTATDEEIKSFLRGTALGLSWIDPAVLRRNGLLCLYGELKEEGENPLLYLLGNYLTSSDPILKETAEYINNSILRKKS